MKIIWFIKYEKHDIYFLFLDLILYIQIIYLIINAIYSVKL